MKKRIVPVVLSAVCALSCVGCRENQTAKWTSRFGTDDVTVTNGKANATVDYAFYVPNYVDGAVKEIKLAVKKDGYVTFALQAEDSVLVRLEYTYVTHENRRIVERTHVTASVVEQSFTVLSEIDGTLQTVSVIPSYGTLGVGTLSLGEIIYSTDRYDGQFCVYLPSSEGEENSSGDQSGDTTSSGDNSSNTSENNSSGDSNWDGVMEDTCPVPQNERLHKKYDEYFYIGMTPNYNRYQSYNDIDGHYSSVTLENEMKMYTITKNADFNYKDPSTYDFSQADEMLTYYRKKGKKIRGHCLLWWYDKDETAEAVAWIKNETDKEVLLEKIDTYCYTVVKHFSDKFGDVIYAWDVVNEAVSDNFSGEKVDQWVKDVYGNIDDGCNQMRSDFYKVGGLDFLTTAFKAARRADPNVKLFYNDYNICQENQKLRGVLNLTAQLIKAGAPIDGIGLQSHFKTTNASQAVEQTQRAIDYIQKLAEVANHPLEIHVTELDTENYGNNDSALASFYEGLFQCYRDNKDVVKSVTFWAVADDYSWLDANQYRMAYPTLFDVNHQKKEAFNSVYNF